MGIDPAENIAKIANDQGIATLPVFFKKELVPKLIKKFGKAGVITSNNTLAHTDALHDIVAGIKEFLDKDGVFVFEVQYLADLLAHNEFDNTYHEHICYYSVHALSYLLRMYTLEIFDIKHTDTHGGGIMVYASHAPSPHTVKKSVREFLQNEKLFGLHTIKPFTEFAKRPPLVKNKLRKLLSDLKKQHKKI